MLRLSAALLAPLLALAQTPAQPPRFEVCDIEISQSPSQPMKAGFLPGGRVDAHNVPLKLMLQVVYKLPESMINGPSWLSSERYDIVAKAPPTSTNDQLFEMVKTMLAERFKMRYHLEKKDTSAFVLVAAKKGPKLAPAEGGREPGCDQTPAEPGAKEPLGLVHRVCHGMTMADLARLIPQMAPAYVEGLPMVDQTGISGTFDFKLDWMARGLYNAAVAANNASAPSDERVVSLFDALEKLGLRMENRKQPLDVLVIDSIERKPTDN